MSKLVFNELYKIFHKKLIYILAILVVLLYVGVAILNKTFTSASSIDSMMIDVYRQSVQNLDLERKEDAELYAQIQPMIETNDITKEKNLGKNSAEKYYLDTVIQSDIGSMYQAKYVDKDEEAYNSLKEQVDKEVASLDNFDWRASVQDQIDKNKDLIAVIEGKEKDILEEEVKVLQYRLDHDIPLSYDDASTFLDDYAAYYAAYASLEKDDKRYVDKTQLYQKKQTEAQVAVDKYRIDNGLIDKNYKSNTAYDSFVTTFGAVSLFVTVCILMIGGQIVAEEYNKGTIKQLLVRPFTRTKIVTSKIIATFITVLGFMLFMAVANSIITGVFTGSFDSLIHSNLVYDFNTSSVVKTNVLLESGLNLLAILPELLIILLFTILMSALVGNTALSVVLGFVLTYIPSMFSLLLDKSKILSFLPMYNWDLTTYLYGGISSNQFLTLPKAIGVDVVTIILLIIGILISFKKKEIKNQ